MHSDNTLYTVDAVNSGECHGQNYLKIIRFIKINQRGTQIQHPPAIRYTWLRKRENSARVTFLSEKISLEVRKEWRNLLEHPESNNKQVTETMCRSILRQQIHIIWKLDVGAKTSPKTLTFRRFQVVTTLPAGREKFESQSSGLIKFWRQRRPSLKRFSGHFLQNMIKSALCLCVCRFNSNVAICKFISFTSKVP